MTTLRDALKDLLENPDLPLEDAADRHFGPDFRQRTNGRWDDRAEFLARIAHLRDNIERITVTVLDEVLDGHRYAERHLVDLLDAHGQRVVQEVYLFADLDSDGRFARIEEVTLSLDVDETDRQQGNAREPRRIPRPPAAEGRHDWAGSGPAAARVPLASKPRPCSRRRP